MTNWINCCGVAIFLAIANVLQLIFFFNYSLKLKDRQVILEKKNGHEQQQIDELKKELAQLKSHKSGGERASPS